METIPFNQLPFADLVFVKGRAEQGRQLFVNREGTHYYKLWYPDWEWATMAQEAWQAGFYDDSWPAGVAGLIEDQHGQARGYVMRAISPKRRLAAFAYPRFSRRGIKTLWASRSRRHAGYLLALLAEVVTRSRASGYMFTELSVPNLWLGNGGYHLFDLDAVRPVKWLFGAQPTDAHFVRSLVNRQALFENIRELLVIHRLPVPQRLTTLAELESYLADRKLKK